MEEKYPLIARRFSLGQSARNRTLWGIRITDNLDKEEDEPEFKYVANMHGDETVGREIMVHFVRELLENYSVNAETRRLIDETDISIVPSMNPDGFELGRRANGNMYDLNRYAPHTHTPPSPVILVCFLNFPL